MWIENELDIDPWHEPRIVGRQANVLWYPSFKPGQLDPIPSQKTQGCPESNQGLNTDIQFAGLNDDKS